MIAPAQIEKLLSAVNAEGLRVIMLGHSNAAARDLLELFVARPVLVGNVTRRTGRVAAKAGPGWMQFGNFRRMPRGLDADLVYLRDPVGQLTRAHERAAELLVQGSERSQVMIDRTRLA